MILEILLGCLGLYGVSLLFILLAIQPEYGWVVDDINPRMMILRMCCLVVRVGVGG